VLPLSLFAKVPRTVEILSDPYTTFAKVTSEQGAKVAFIQQSPHYLQLGEDIEEDIAFCHLNH
jgi:hypothetical protein